MGLLYELLGLVVVFELDFLQMSNLGVHVRFLFADVLLLDLLAVVVELRLSFQSRLDLVDWVLWIRLYDTVVVVGIDHDTSLLEDSVLPLSATCFDVPYKFVLVTLKS